MVLFGKNKCVQSVIILSIVSTGCLAGSNGENDLLQGQRLPVPVAGLVQSNVSISVADVELENPPPRQTQKILAVTAAVLEVSIESLPFILAYLSNRSYEYNLASLGQNVLYASMYAFRLARNSCSESGRVSVMSNLFKIICLTNTINSGIAAFSCWRYYETLESDYRLINMGFNGVVGTVTFPLKMFARRNLFHKLWYGS